MRALLAGSASTRSGIVLAASGIVAALMLALAHTAVAGDDLGIRRIEFWPWSDGTTLSPPMPVVPRPIRHHPRRIWAASHARPLRIALDRHRPSARWTSHRLVRRSPVAQPRVVFAQRIVLPKPPRSTLVSIFQDSTLRNGDAVMMSDGIHVFHGVGAWPLRPRDFVRLPLAASLGWHLRQSLNDLDRNPPTRWTSMETTSG
ncbi:MAG: hypothetical protein ACRYGP_24780 [Janthinobacterium lividum]